MEQPWSSNLRVKVRRGVERCRRIRLALFVPLAFAVVGQALAAEERVSIAEVSPNVIVFATSNGNVVASVGPDGAFLIGTPSVGSTPEIARALAARTANPVRYVVISPQPLSQSEGDAGWGRLGAFVAMQENALGRLGGHSMGPPQPLPPRLVQLGADRPRIAFSEVISFDVNGEAIHVVHQPPGYSNADAITHFHVAQLIYLGELFPGNGYPDLDPSQGANLSGLIKTATAWTSKMFRIVPVYGPVVTGAELKIYGDMLVAVRDRIQQLIQSGASEQQIIAQHPTAEFDARWGHGQVSSEAFVHSVYVALTSQ